MELFRLVLPYLFVLFFVIRGIKESFYFLGIPFLMFMSYSIFFEDVRLFSIPGRLVPVLMFIWLVFLWIISIIIRIYTNSEKNETNYIRRLNGLDYCIIGLMIITFLGFGMTLIKYSILKNVFKEFLTLISLFTCYFIIKNWSSHNKPEILLRFLFSLVIINSIASVLYILHQGLGLKIYLANVHLEGIFRGVEITRTFDFMPRMFAFSVAFLLVFNEKRLFSFILLIINLLAIFITYTRSYLINVAIIFLFYFILIGFKKKSLKLVLKNVLIYGVLGFFGFIMLSKFLPANTEFFLDRFANIAKSSNSGEINTLEYRFLMTGKVISNIDENKRVFGMGSVTENQISWIPAMRLATSDMVWAGVIFRWGFIGLILFTMLYIFSIFSSFSFYMKSEGALSDLALFFLLFIISQIVESFVSWTFLNGHGFAVGLWYFAMLSALFGFNKSKLLSKNKIFSND